MAALVIAGGTSAEVLVDYQFDEASGTGLSKLSNGGTATGSWADEDNATTDGNGALHVVAGKNKVAQKYALDSTLTSGTVEITLGISAYDFTEANTNSVTGMDSDLGVESSNGDNIGSGLRLDAPDDVYVRSHTVGAYNNVGPFPVSTNAVLETRLVINLDTYEYQAYYGWGAGNSTLKLKGSTFLTTITNGISTVEISIENNSFIGNDFVDVDYFKIETIPEPAALGMIAAVSAGLLFIRRRFMI